MFGGFRASLNFFGKKNKNDLHSELYSDMSVSGAYRTSRDDSFAYKNSFDQTKRTATEQMLQIRPTKSTTDLTKPKNIPNIRHSTGVSNDPRGAETSDLRNGRNEERKDIKNQNKDQKKIEKQHASEQKVREKQTAKEQVKQEKSKREKEKREAQQNKAKKKRKPEKKRQAPQPQPMTSTAQTQYSTNTLESSISRSSGPPPYSEVPRPHPELTRNVTNQSGASSNVIFSKPVDTGSWDMISQHREQINRPTTNVGSSGKQNKQMVMDLNYNFGETNQAKDNSDA